MGLIALVLWAIVVGAIIGALGRLVVPGRNPIGIALTILLGIVGAIVGSLIGHAIHVGVVITFVLEVLIAALLVYLVSGRRRRSSRLT
jgi:uncharacterized membrane protein YeaQ/YmgE (transglycosylase-associated protein family)